MLPRVTYRVELVAILVDAALGHAVAVRELGSEDGAVAISIEDTEGVVQVLLNRVRVTHESRQWR